MTIDAPAGVAQAQILRALARLSDYPSAALVAHVDELDAVVAAISALGDAQKAELRAFVADLGAMELLDAQARFVETFDRGRKVSLYIFEHVYGESRDRGPAMVEIAHAYREQGLELATGELPDYLPVFLEFCAQLPPDEARGWLLETTHMLQRLQVRLTERDNPYAAVFTALLQILEVDPAPENLTQMAGSEQRDDTAAAIDQVWEEKPVTFGPDEEQTTCGSTKQTPSEKRTAGQSPETVQGQ